MPGFLSSVTIIKVSTAVYDERLCLSAVKFQILIEVKQPIQCCDNLINSYVIQINNAPVMLSTLEAEWIFLSG